MSDMIPNSGVRLALDAAAADYLAGVLRDEIRRAETFIANAGTGNRPYSERTRNAKRWELTQAREILGALKPQDTMGG